MKIVFSRKGVDSGAGRCVSPVIDGRCLSLPIPAPANLPSGRAYNTLDLPAPVEDLSRRALRGTDMCHADPAFANGRATLGQVGAAQTHLDNQAVGPGDVFLFFGAFGEELRRAHRIFGFLRVETVRRLGSRPTPEIMVDPDHPHPHSRGDLAEWPRNNTVYLGEGAGHAPADDALCLTVPHGNLTEWVVPGWLAGKGMTYHRNPANWTAPGHLRAAARGQEFVTDIGDDSEPHRWLDDIIARIRA